MALELQDSRLGRVVAACSNAGRSRVLTVAAVMIVGIAVSDWYIGLNISLGPLYIIPMMLVSVVLPPRAIMGIATLCTVLRMAFDDAGSAAEAVLRFVLVLVAFSSVGLFVSIVLNSHQLAMESLARVSHEQELRSRAEEQLRALVESSPAAIVTLDETGGIVAANNAAGTLLGLESGEPVIGRAIEGHLPVLGEALRFHSGSEPFRTSVQCQGRRKNGEVFLADVWFSTYESSEGRRLAAIVVDSSEEMREREEQNLRQLSIGSRVFASAVLHEVRNLCSAFSVVYSNLKQREGPCRVEDLAPLDELVQSLRRMTSLDLARKEPEELEPVSVPKLMDDLRIVIEPGWAEIDGRTVWDIPANLPRVRADRHGLLQVLLNLAQNSHRAVQESEVRELHVGVCVEEPNVLIRLRDTGSGVKDTGRLFQPFQPGAASTGLGLYISRALLRSYGGELRYKYCGGACFTAQVPMLAEEGE
jgi:two-component system, LuxR family, sensor kinase FixL